MCILAAGMLQRLVRGRAPGGGCKALSVWLLLLHDFTAGCLLLLCSVEFPGAHFRIYVTELWLYRELQAT